MNRTGNELKELENICMPIVEHMRRNYMSSDAVIITGDWLKMVSAQMGVEFNRGNEALLEDKNKLQLVEIQGEDISSSKCLTEAISKKRPTFEDHIRANYHEAGKEKVAVEIGKLLNGFSMTEAKDILSMVSYELDKVAYIKTE